MTSRPSDSELFTLFERSPVGMYRSTRAGEIKYANPAFAAMLGYRRDEVMALNVIRDIYVDATIRSQLEATYGPKGMIDGAVVQWRRKDGRVVDIRLYGHITEANGGESFDATVVDITEQNRAQYALQRTAATLDVVVDQAAALWWIVGPDFRMTEYGGPFERVMGFDPTVNLGKTFREVGLTDAVLERTESAHEKALAGEFVRYSSEYLDRVLENTVAPYRVGGVVVGAVGTAVDVTAVRTLERRMVDAQRAESLGVLAGGLAHDFNNLLVAILGNADLALRDVGPGKPGRLALENIRQASLRAAELTDQLLAYAGHGSVSSQRVAPAPIVEELLRISAPQLAENVTISVEIPAELTLRGDAAQVRQVVMNLIGNAREALGSRGGSIHITGAPLVIDGSVDRDDVLTASTGVYIQLAVTDDGPGLDSTTRRRIFDPFFTTKATGHGLGLASVLGIVRAHGGGLRVRSAPGHGARFEVLWPSTATPAEQANVTAPTRTVLVVDDEELVRDVVARMIQDLGYGAITAADGPSAIAIAETAQIDAALVDLTMPRMSGAEVVTALRARHPNLPIVLCTGFDRDRHGPVAADAFLPKPFRLEALEDILHRLVPTS